MKTLEDQFEELTIKQLNKIDEYDNINGASSINPERVKLHNLQWEWINQNFIPKFNMWIDVKEKMPENQGCYLCRTNDDWQMVCFINAIGTWTLRPGGAMYGDLCGADKYLGLGEKREITHWMNLPKK